MENEKKQRLYIFKTLMATRAVPLSPEHVNALNRIDLEFHSQEKVIDAWRLYLDHLNSPTDHNWLNKKVDLFVELLYRMGESIGYSFKKLDLKNAMYFPVGHGEWQEDSLAIRKGVLGILNGKSEILVKLVSSGEEKKQN